MVDFFDPNTWENVSSFEYRVYADDYANEYAIVDQEDYQYLIQWRWKLSKSKKTSNGKDRKVYLARAVPEIIGKDYKDENGVRKQQRIVSTVYLHTIVMERKQIRPKSNGQLIVDHANSNGFDCRRSNLRWATRSFNNMNRFGKYERMLFDEYGEHQC